MEKKKLEKFTTVTDVLQISSSVVADYMQYQKQQDALAHILVFAELEVIKQILVAEGLITKEELESKVKSTIAEYKNEVVKDLPKKEENSNPKMGVAVGDVEVEVFNGRDVEN